MEPGRSPSQLIADSEGLLLDFDGPVCDVYAGSDPARIARDVAAVFDLAIDTDDPLDLIIHAIGADGLVDQVHHALEKAEVDAVRSATETAGIRQLVASYEGPIAIVSNNAAHAIESWLVRANLRPLFEQIIGRDPRRMKPNPWPVGAAVRSIGRRSSECVLVGDSLSDAKAALRAEVPFVAFANKAGKRAMFEAAGCHSIVDQIEELHPRKC